MFDAEVSLGDLNPREVRVELYAEGLKGGPPVRQEMAHVRELEGMPGHHVYSATVPSSRPKSDYTARILPSRADVTIPLEVGLILWQR